MIAVAAKGTRSLELLAATRVEGQVALMAAMTAGRAAAATGRVTAEVAATDAAATEAAATEAAAMKAAATRVAVVKMVA